MPDLSILRNATLVIMALTVLTSVWAFSHPKLLDRLMLKPDRVWYKREWWRLLTAGFVHKDYAHLGFNLFTFVFFGLELERICTLYHGRNAGAAAFLLLYLGGIVVANIPTLLMERTNPRYASLGASGGVAAVLFAAIVLSPLRKLYLLFIPVGIPGFIFGAAYALFSFVQARRKAADGINHDAHLTGALYGIGVILLLIPPAGPIFLSQLLSWFVALRY